ncbi:RHS repeat-associated core domain-containing protein [Chryseobacterium soldanellicola]|uniref:RHS repeat-associated core domain-containing protein n=1 Tax=Chryseobacterium soldanellicola TaxID=311333 RepID=A0A1H1E0A3_9FLAO|nr:DUF6443 domain-containing protein [Chryseobacterium soldanellicola]SDQ82063.1 RHS repeat-associated core domain-containing protein [Chryseobacterium soldanellicola]
MKKILLPIGALLLSGLAQGQLSNTENYVYSKTYLSDPTLSNPRTSETVQYFDGLGRPKQVVNVKASPQGKDVVTYIEYDNFGRQVKDYLPVPQSQTLNGAVVPTPLANATNTPYGTEKIYSEKILESSPLDRVLQQKQVGNAWDTKPVQFDYNANIDGDVKKYVATFNYSTSESSITQSGSYGTGQLYKNSITDEDGNQTIEFKNGQGQVLLVRKVNGTENVNTYYVYNDYDQLAYVIPPKASIITDVNTVLNDLCYQYKYDSRNRLVEKKLPGKGWEYMVYDKQDRLVATQDAVLKEKGQWLYTKYDQFGRVAITGIGTGNQRSVEQTTVDSFGSNNVTRVNTPFFNRQGIDVYYNNPDGSYPNSSNWVTLLSLNYYDAYPGYDFNPSFPTNISGETTLTDVPNTDGISTKGLPVMSLVKNIEDDNWTKDYTYYDKKARVVGKYSINHLGGRTKVDSKLDFAGIVKQTVTTHKRLDTDTDHVITENFEYDTQNRLLVHKHQVDSNPVEILTQNTYNELSQIINKKVGGIVASDPLQSIDYAYNIRGWMTKINDPANLSGKLFGYEMRYTNPIDSNIAPARYNGNIAEVDWKNSTENVLKRYNYEYDNLNRLKNAFYKEPTTGNSNYFDEYLTYDLNGNISNLKRTAIPISGATGTMVDNLDYIYSGNRLTQVIENQINSTGYEGGNNMIDYDLNGSMTNMKDKGIQSIIYNHLSLPDGFAITQNDPWGGTPVNFGLSYLYRADGIKIRKTYTTGGGRGQSTTNNYTDYLDGFQYSYAETLAPCTWCRTSVAYEEQAFLDPVILDPPPISVAWSLDFVPTSEGFYSFAENRYIYKYTDHLGNVRVSFTKDGHGALEVTNTNNYYAFGMNHIGGTKALLGGYQNYKYNGKEIQESGMYDYGARFYMPDLGRWGVVDPLAEQMRRYSPYNYAFNNPISFIDPDGRKGTDWVYNTESNSVYWNNSATSQASAGVNERYLGKNGTYTAENGSTTALYSDGTYTNNSIAGILPNLDPTIQAPYTMPADDGSYIRETPSLNTQEGAFANPAAQLASTMLTAIQEAPAAVAPELIAAKYFRGMTFYRSMSQEAADVFTQTGKMPAGTETFISPTRSFAEGYEGVTFKINIKHSTYADLLDIGVKDASSAHPFSSMPSVGKGWKSTNAFFKVEGNQLNVGLGNGKALDIFNSGIKSAKPIP